MFNTVMDVAKVKSIESLKRGLDVLALISQGEGLQLGELHTRSGIPKASLLRILRTLQESGRIQRRVGDGAYLPVATERRSKQHKPARVALADLLPKTLDTLAQAIPWPSDVAVCQGLKMRVIDSNRAAYGPHWRRTVIGAEVEMIGSAMGRAYLAFSRVDVRQNLLQQLLGRDGAKARKRDAILAELESTRARGYGSRDGLYPGPDADHGKQLSAIAVPILVDGVAMACISCVWSVEAVSKADILQRCLTHLVRHAALLGKSLETG